MSILLRTMSAFFVLALLVFGTQTAEAASSLSSLPSDQCDLSGGTSPCPSADPNNAVGSTSPNGGYDAVRSIAGTAASVAIDAFGYCRYINNNGANSLFVPFKTSGEWLAFLGHLPSGVSTTDCSRGGSVNIPPNFGSAPQNNQCVSNPTAQPVKAPYRSYVASQTYIPQQVTFNCRSPDGTSFTETAISTLTGTDSGTGSSTAVGWNVSAVSYIYNAGCGSATSSAPSNTSPTGGLCHIGPGTTPTINSARTEWIWTCLGGSGGGSSASCSAPYQPPINGVCGSANGVATTTGPSGSLCVTGTASGVSGSGPWSWLCSGSYGGTTASCDTPLAAVNGVCGSSNGATLASAPTSGLCNTGASSGVSGSGPWSWSCAGNSTGSAASCSAALQPPEACIPTGQPVPPGQTQCPTKSCFFWVSGIALDNINNFSSASPVSKIGDPSLTWQAAIGPAGSNGVGAGEYPDAYGNSSSPGPFFLAANGSFDGIAIGTNTRLIVYQGTNYSGPVLFDQHGPMVVNDYYVDTSDWSSSGDIFQQFPPSTRHLSSDPALGISNAPNVGQYGFGPWNLWVLSGLPSGSDGFGFGPTSIKVICDN